MDRPKSDAGPPVDAIAILFISNSSDMLFRMLLTKKPLDFVMSFQ